MKAVLCCVAVIFYSCTEPNKTRNLGPPNLFSNSIESLGEFGPYVDSFRRDFFFYEGIDLQALAKADIRLVDELPGTAVGMCYYKRRSIRIQRDYWERSDEVTREALIYHELGHCYLNRRHRDAYVEGKPVSLMFSNMSVVEHYYDYRDEYLEELFTKRSDQFKKVSRPPRERNRDNDHNLDNFCLEVNDEIALENPHLSNLSIEESFSDAI